MRTQTNINEAVKMIEYHDWDWGMCDYGYEANYNSAKAHMKSFVKLVNTIGNAQVRETLRTLWVLVFNSKMEEYRSLKTKLLNAYAA